MGYGWKWEKWNKGKEEGRNIIISKDVGVDNFRWCSYCRTLLFFLFFSLRYMKWGKKKIFTFSALFRPSIIFCSRYGYGKSKPDIGNDCFLLLVWHNNGCNGLLLLPQNSSSGERELAQCLLCPAVSWYLEAGNDDIHRSYTRWPCIVSNVVIYILPWLRSNLAWYPSV